MTRKKAQTAIAVQDMEQAKWDTYYASLPLLEEDAVTKAFGEEFAATIAPLLPAGSTTLEAGCGAGWQSLALARSGHFNVCLLDFSQQALSYAQWVFEREGRAALFIQEDVFKPGTPDYDLVFNAGVLEHYTFDEQVACLRGMASRSKKYVLVLVPNKLCYWYWLWRISAAGSGNWPYGKEVPLIDLSAAFEAAGLHVVGQTFMAANWTENFIGDLPGMSEDLRDEILEIHRSQLAIPDSQKSYLVAFLGSVTPPQELIAPAWSSSLPKEAMSQAEVNALLADALSLKIGAEQSAARLRLQQTQQEAELARERAQLHAHIATLQQTREELLNQRREQLQQTREELLNQQREQLQQTREKLLKVIEGLQTSFAAREQELVTERAHLVGERENLVTQLNVFYGTKAWQVTYAFWQLRRGGLKSWFGFLLLLLSLAVKSSFRLLYFLIHSVYHLLVPYRVRIVFWAYRQRRRRAVTEALEQQPNDQALLNQRTSELRGIIARHPEAKGVVVFAPTVDWNVTLFQRPHQMALAFAAQGYLVLYWVHVDSKDKVIGFQSVEDRLYLANAPSAVLDILDQPLVFAYPYNYPWVSRLKAPRVIYELIDRLEIFSEYPLALLRHYHEKLLTMATLVVGTADELVKDMVQQRPDALLCPNAVDMAHFAGDGSFDHADLPRDIQAIVAEGKPIIGYYGALAQWFDYDLVKYAAKHLPGYNFVLIGPDYDASLAKSGIKEFANIYWLGPKEYRQLPKYLHAFDVATIPFLITDTLQAVSPIKLFEYMAGKRPIVTTDLLECRKYPVVLVAKSREEWVAQLQKALRLGQDTRYLEELQATARQNTWQARVSTIVTALAEKPAGQARVSSSSAAFAEPTLEGEWPVSALQLPATQFQKAVQAHFSASGSTHPMLETWIRYALETNERGKAIVQTIQRDRPIFGKRYLDIGCAYGGSVIAFAEAGAEAYGLEIDPALLQLARANLADHPGVNCTLLAGDILQEGVLTNPGPYDIVTCENVIEHVAEARKLVAKIGKLLAPSGLCHLAIPNPFSFSEVRQDGHYSMFGLTLLDRPRAIEYFHAMGTEGEYGVGEYCFTFEDYAAMFCAAGLSMELLNPPTLETDSLSRLHNDIIGLLAEFHRLTEKAAIPAQLQEEVFARLVDYIQGFEKTFQRYQFAQVEAREHIAAEILRAYRQDLWFVLVRPRPTP